MMDYSSVMITRIPVLVLVLLELTECSSSKCGLQSSNHTAATAHGLSSQRSNFSVRGESHQCQSFKFRERTQIRAGSRTLVLEEDQLQSSNHTAATALGLSSQHSNFSVRGESHQCQSFHCPYCGSASKDPPLYPDREKERAKQVTEQREQQKLRERTQI
jgi:hypothetical protein